MIDDDEIASLNWVERMVRAAEATGADVVGGPVLPVSTTTASGTCAAIRRSARPMKSAGRCR